MKTHVKLFLFAFVMTINFLIPSCTSNMAEEENEKVVQDPVPAAATASAPEEAANDNKAAEQKPQEAASTTEEVKTPEQPKVEEATKMEEKKEPQENESVPPSTEQTPKAVDQAQPAVQSETQNMAPLDKHEKEESKEMEHAEKKVSEEKIVEVQKTDVEITQKEEAKKPVIEKAEATAEGDMVYIVRDGETLTSIAKKLFGNAAKWKELQELNKDKINNVDKIFAGDIIVVGSAEGKESIKFKNQKALEEDGELMTDGATPSPILNSQEVVVQKGDTLFDIAHEKLGSGLYWKMIWLDNKQELKNPNVIYPGLKLKVAKLKSDKVG